MVIAQVMDREDDECEGVDKQRQLGDTPKSIHRKR
jgi:hypothetical protein